MTKRNWMFGALVAIGSLVGSAGAHAEFVLDNWTFNADGVDGLTNTGLPANQDYTITGIDTWTFNAGFEQDLVDTNGNNVQDVGEHGTVSGIGKITDMLNGPSGLGVTVAPITLNFNGAVGALVGFEVTFDFQVDYVVTASSAGGFDFAHTAPTLTTGLLNIYVDNLSDGSVCNTGSGAGCSDGELVGTFLVQAGGGGTVKFTVFDGSDDATFEAVFLKDGVWFDQNGNDLGCNNAVAGEECSGSPLLMSDSNFDADPDSNNLLDTQIGTRLCGDPRLGGAQTAAHNCGAEDGSVILAAVPEPTSLAIFSIGLVMLGGVVGMLRQRPN